jgi:DNA polymerase III sliding clamp (beta) subunit (PCNA family)
MAAIQQDDVEIETSGELDPIVIRGRDSTESVHVVMPVRM